MRTPPLDNVKVRQAVMAALNHKLIVNNIFFGLGKVATSPFVTTEMFYDKNMPQLDFNKKKARALVKETGKIGRESCRDRVCQNEWISVCDVSSKKKKKIKSTE